MSEKIVKKALITGENKGIGTHADEVAKTILWLATESPEYINGTTIDINSGSYAR